MTLIPDETWTIIEDKRADMTDEYVPISDEPNTDADGDGDADADEEAEVVEEVGPVVKRKLGDSLRLGKRLAFFDDEAQVEI